MEREDAQTLRGLLGQYGSDEIISEIVNMLDASLANSEPNDFGAALVKSRRDIIANCVNELRP